jgi:putative Ig domain-containing protein
VAGSTPEGLTFNETNNDTVYIIGGKPWTPGTYNLTVEFYAGTDKASASFTLVVNEDPNLKRLP